MAILQPKGYTLRGDSTEHRNSRLIEYQSQVLRTLHKSLQLGYKLSYSGAAFIIEAPTDKFVIRARPLSWDGDYMRTLNSIEGMIDERIALLRAEEFRLESRKRELLATLSEEDLRILDERNSSITVKKPYAPDRSVVPPKFQTVSEGYNPY